MTMTGESSAAVSIICPSCGECYDSAERVTEILRNSGFCVNLTCLQDLSSAPLDAALAPPEREQGDPAHDRPPRNLNPAALRWVIF